MKPGVKGLLVIVFFIILFVIGQDYWLKRPASDAQIKRLLTAKPTHCAREGSDVYVYKGQVRTDYRVNDSLVHSILDAENAYVWTDDMSQLRVYTTKNYLRYATGVTFQTFEKGICREWKEANERMFDPPADKRLGME